MDRGFLGWAAAAVHLALYGLVLATVAVDLLNVWARGDSLFGLFRIQKLALGGPGLKEQVEDLYELCANAILVVAGVHASAALISIGSKMTC